MAVVVVAEGVELTKFTRLRRLRTIAAVPVVVVTTLTVTSAGSAAADSGGVFTVSPSPALPANSGLNAVTAFGENDAWVVGETPTGTNNQPEPLVEHWDGNSWQVQATPDVPGGFLNSVAAVGRNDVWAVGEQEYPPPPPGQPRYYGNPALLLHWDGTTWTRFGEPFGFKLADVNLLSVTAIASDDAWAVGDVYSNGYVSPIAMHWDGTSWSVSALPGDEFPERLASVSADAGDDVWATGLGGDSSGNLRMLVEHWDGTAWSVQPAPDPSLTDGHAITTDSVGDVFAAGVSGKYADSLPSIVGSYDGSAWTNSTPPNDYVQDLAPDQQGGVWTASFRGPAASVQHWDGTTWTPATLPAVAASGVMRMGIATSASGATTWMVLSQNSQITGGPSSLILRNG